jgi:hypothetical protein
MTATAPKIPDDKALKHRAALCLELLNLRHDNAKAFDRIEAIKTELKAMATDLGRGFRETEVELGYVSVSPARGEQFGGDFPIVNVRAWQALTPTRRQKLVDDGLIGIESVWSKPFYGSVTVEVF